MFRYKRSILSVFVVLIIAFTWLVAYMTASWPWENAFWYQMGGIMVSEALLGFVAVGFGNNSERSLPFRAGNMVIGVLHLVYSFAMLGLPCSDNCVLLWVLGGLIAALLMHAFFAFAQHDMKADETAEKAAFGLRNELMATLEMLEVSKKDMICGDAALAKAFEKAKDAARFVSDSVPGCESADAEVRTALSALGRCADAEAMTRAAADLVALIEVRQNIVKRSR